MRPHVVLTGLGLISSVGGDTESAARAFVSGARGLVELESALTAHLRARFAGLENDPDTARLVATVVLAEQIADLRANGVENFHFYTLNQSHLTYAACQGLRV